MKDYMLSNAMRFFFLVASVILWTGIFLTGVCLVHGVLFIPAFSFLFAAVVGICPGIILSKKLFGKKEDKPPEE